MLTHSRPLFEEIRMVGQICREGMDESDIFPKAGYAMTVSHLLWIIYYIYYIYIFYVCAAYKSKGEIHLN